VKRYFAQKAKAKGNVEVKSGSNECQIFSGIFTKYFSPKQSQVCSFARLCAVSPQTVSNQSQVVFQNKSVRLVNAVLRSVLVSFCMQRTIQ
jgi:hypothetical protein